MNGDELIQQIYAWLDQDEGFDIEALLDLPDMGWVTVHRMSDRGDLINLSYRRHSISSLLSKAPSEMVCERAAVKAVRRVERSNLDEFLKDQN